MAGQSRARWAVGLVMAAGVWLMPPGGAVVAQPTVPEPYRLVDTWTTRRPQGGAADLQDPGGVDVAEDETIYAVDRRAATVYHLTAQGQTITSWATDARIPIPADVAVSRDRVVVIGSTAGEIRTRDGGLIRTFALSGAQGVAFGPDRRIYVSRRQQAAGTSQALIDVLDVDGNVLETWRDERIAIFTSFGIDVGPDNRVYLAADGAVYVFVDGRATELLRARTGLEGPDILDVAVDGASRVFAVQRETLLAWDAARSPAARLDDTGILVSRAVAVGPGTGLLASTVDNAFQGLSYLADRGSLDGTWQRWGDADETLGTLQAPRRLATSPTGDVFIADGLQQVQRWTAAGLPAERWAGSNFVDIMGGRAEPCGLRGHLITCLGPAGATRWEVSPSAGGWLTAADGSGTRVAAVDMAEQHVWLYDRNGTPAGGFDLAPANGFVAVSDIALDAGFIYLANRSAHEITVYRPDGQRERSIATPGEAIRLAAADGALYFLAQDGWAWKLDGAGNVRSAWQPAPDGAPSDIAVGPGGRVYVADPRHDRVLVFEPGGQAPAQLPSRPSQSCAVNVDKRAAPAQVYQGEPATVALAVTGGCPLGDGRLDVVLVLDQSGSMTSEGIAAVQSAAIAFLSELNPAGAQVAVVGFSTTATVLKPLGGNLRELVRAVAGITPGGQTNYVDALDKAYNEITGPSSRADVARVVVMMTDGKPTDRAGVAEATARLKGVGVTLYTIGLGQNLDADLLRSMATTPDLYFEAPTETELAEIYVTIARRIAAPNLLRTATVTDELPADMAYVAGSAIPPAQLSGRALTWTLNDVPATGQVLSYLVRPQQPGRRPTNTRAVLDFVDVTGQAGQRTFPVPEITVLARTRWLAHLPVVYRNRCQPQRADVVLVFDTSSSMLEPAAPGSATTKLQAALQAARTFLDAMMLPGDQVALVTFNTDVRLAAPLTGSRAVVEFALAGIQTGTGTRIDLGLRAASAELLSSRHQAHNTPVIVLLTDGLPTAGSEAAALAEARLARSGGAAVFTIGLGSNADLTLLSLLASNPANTFFAPKADALASIYSRIAGKVLCE